ncbi:uncharacterized protein LOC106660234 [Trichogramma pretiosum]|uniref:uncharacterized protein LOC106660234 n=1 Tax=Trichogramma pretiosum TaxID=7493 RepID=UPI0006C980F4|nr:uncharacterized protein LOC106660234 [Trichogramma pretiosum]
MSDMRVINRRNSLDLCQENLFNLQCLVKANDIRYATAIENHEKQLVAFAIGPTDLGIYYLREAPSKPIIKRVPWFQCMRKKIACLCFDPSGSWLLVGSIDGSVYIVPVKTVIDEPYAPDQKWTTQDVTSFLSVNSQNSYGRPSAIAWWHGVSFAAEIGVIGTEQGEIVFINLETGQQVSITKVEGRITSLSICQDTELDKVLMLITNHAREQWYLLLEKSGSNYTYPLNTGSQRITTNGDDIDNEERTFPMARARLRGLKQMSFQKLNMIKQKLAETRNRLDPTPPVPVNNIENKNNENVSLSNSSDSNDNSNEIIFFSHEESDNIYSTTPIPVCRDMYVIPQILKNGCSFFANYIPSKDFVTIHQRCTTLKPTMVHRLPRDCLDIQLTCKLIYVLDTKHRFVQIVSRVLSEERKGNYEIYNDFIIAKFSFDKSEEVINSIFVLSANTQNYDTSDNIKLNYKDCCIANNIVDLNSFFPPLDSCLVITNLGIYRIDLRSDITQYFLDLILIHRALEDSIRLGDILGMRWNQLMEYAGDIVLCKHGFGQAMELYSYAKCPISKCIYKFAAVGYTADLLKLLVAYSSSPVITEVSETNRIHYSNLSVLAFTELFLRALPPHKEYVQKDLLHFLSTNTTYDQLYAIKMAIKTHLWFMLEHLLKHKGLGPQVLDFLVASLPSFANQNALLHTDQNKNGLLMCLSDPSLIQGILNNLNSAKNHICFVQFSLPTLPIPIIDRLLKLYDPTNPSLRPLLTRLKIRRRTASRCSFSSQCDSLDFTEDGDDSSMCVEEIVNTFILLLLTVLHRQQPSVTFRSEFMPLTHPLEFNGDFQDKSESIDVKRRVLSAGFGHVALIRNGNIMTWGNAMQGCLGTGPIMSRFETPKTLGMFHYQGIEVLSVSCGRWHTLSVTNNGVYAWGSNVYGQLGLGDLRETPNPELIVSLAQEVIVDAVAGPYHSVALTADGRIFSWGWGVYGQLGHGSTELSRYPTMVKALVGIDIRHISAGYAHTLALSADGYVYGFGCNMFGQLGTGDDSKHSLPIKISLIPEKITAVDTKYFHNLAISVTNKLYVWGCNPTILRLQSKERKLRLQRARQAMETMEREMAEKKCHTSPIEEFAEALKTEEGGELKKSLSDRNLNSACSLNIEIEKDLEDSMNHLVPELVDISRVQGKIVQISCGFFHSALLTHDGKVHTWGRNIDGQLGIGTSRDVTHPAPVTFLSFDNNSRLNTESENEKDRQPGLHPKDPECELTKDYVIKAVKISCGGHFTVIQQPGGKIFAWGANTTAQLGRPPINDDSERFLLQLKNSKRFIRRPNQDRLLPVNLSPSQVPGIPAMMISYQTYDNNNLSGTVKPLSSVEPNMGELTLHYTLEEFHGLYSFSKIFNKCEELKKYQACAKLDLIERNMIESMTNQLRALKESDPDQLVNIDENSSPDDKKINEQLEVNNMLFEKHVERNVVDILIESAEKEKIKMPVSKSLDSFRILEEELHTFDCQGGSEEMFDADKKEILDLDCSQLSNNDLESSIENVTLTGDDFKDSSHNDSSKINETICMDEKETLKMQYAMNIVDFYLSEVEEEQYMTIYDITGLAINFWVENRLDVKDLEKVFIKYMKKIYYPLALLIYSDKETMTNSITERNMKNIRVKNAVNILSTDFCLKVCSYMIEHIEDGKPAVDFVEMLSESLAKNYGPPLIGYPGTSENRTSEQMMEGIVSTLSASYNDPRAFIHIKDSDKVSELMAADEDSMIFTCGHQYLLSTYKSETVPRMEADLLALRSPLPSTAQLLGSILIQSHKPETLCPPCLTQVLKDATKSVDR